MIKWVKRIKCSYQIRADLTGFRGDHSQCYTLLGQMCLRHGESDEAFQYILMAQTIAKAL